MMKRTQVLKKPRIAVDVYCCYPHRVCMQPRVDGYEYCINHILEDKASPYKQCAYISSKSGKRCPNAAPKADRKEGYCLDHSKKAAALRQRAVQVKRPVETPETLLDELDHYQVTDQPADPVGSKTTKPGTDSPASRLLDYASSSDSDDQMLVDQAWAGDQDSDAESIDSDQEDPLKHAGVYTAEEVAWITRDKLIRLQSLYIDQFKRLQHLLKEKRRKYLHAVRQQKDSDGTLESAKEDPEQRIKYDTLMALRRYHKRHGKEALLHRQSRERRIAMSEGPNYKAPSYPKCAYTDETTKCTARTLPLAKYCYKHILSDPSQSLYQSCGFADGACSEPIAKLPGASPCLLHRKLPEITARLPKPEPTLLDASHIDVVSTESGQDHLYSQAQLSQLPDQIMADPDPEPMEEDGGENKAEKVADAAEASKDAEGKIPPEDAEGTTLPKVEEGKPPECKEEKKPEVTSVEATVKKEENVSELKKHVQEIEADIKLSISESQEGPPKTEQEPVDKMEITQEKDSVLPEPAEEKIT